MKLNLGCGKDYRAGWVNIDANPLVKFDKCVTLGRYPIPCGDNSVDEVFMSHSLEHIKDFWGFIDDLYRVCKNGATLHIITPHATAWGAYTPQHYTQWSISAFGSMYADGDSATGESYAKFKCKADNIRLNWLSHYGRTGVGKLRWIGLLFELLANSFGWHWKLFAERWPFGWSEVEYRLTVVK